MLTSKPVLVRSRSHESLDKVTAHTSMTMSFSDVATNFSESEDADLYALPSTVAERLVKSTAQRVSQVLAQSPFVLGNCSLYDLPRFDREDLEITEMIAAGGFSNVHGIAVFRKGGSELVEGSNAGKKYIIKHLNPKLALNPKKLLIGAKDLVMEAHFLSALSHKHIIQLRGWSASGVAGFSETNRADGFFLVFERLGETLSKRISTWRARALEMKKGSSLMKNRSSSHNTRIQLFTERVKTAIEISDAVEYLHSKRIVYRDLKPANIGFDQEGVLKLFDFGLAVELPEGSDPDSTFNLAGNTGTARYMAIEVIRKQPYNCKVDVFSFTVLLWELMALCKPYDGLDGQQVKECVAVFGERPVIPRNWPTSLRRILRRGWSESLAERPRMTEVKDVLETMLEASSKPKLFGK